MSTENEGNAVPSAPSAPSTPPAPPSSSVPAEDAHDAAPREPKPPHVPPLPGHTPAPAAPDPAPTEHPAPAPYPAQAPHPAPHPAPPAGAGWPTPPPPPPTWGAPLPPAGDPPRKRSGGGLVSAVLAAALLAGGIGGGIGYWAAERNDGSTSSTTVAAGEAPADFEREPGTIAAVANKALPSVVTIEAKSGASEREGGGEGGTGTGFVYDKEGHILTNNHVVASAAEGGTLSATFSNGKTYDAEVVGRAQGYDVAVLKLKNAPSGLAPLPLGNSDKVVVGDSTIAIGAPFGLSNTVTTGIISAKNRPVASGDGSGAGRNSYMSALQTDASINPGNSGGPLLDARGAVIGINSAIQSAGSGGLGQSQAGSIGLGFAIPINQAKSVADQLIKTGKPVYPVIGATVNMTEEGEGARIADQGEGGTPAVLPNGPAAKAGLKPGDVITKFGDRTIDSGPTLISEIWTHKPGDKVTLTYERGGKASTVDVTLGERKGD
ncbi:protease [Streptomyces sp. CB03234]|uniref:S1C family serine protease n=1 Tax=Streptomyces sp. (strain CB03234) TaxID=1703937 RepID=UPI000938D32F|nr:trypsin-like peptidase domain-containing protein [Streptomyces sp. CB03234]OKK02258.1 protease [Streptomyces sp. CB03234]